MALIDIILARCTHSRARTYQSVVFTQSTCDDCGDISISPTDYAPWTR